MLRNHSQDALQAVRNLADFSALVNELETLDPVAFFVRPANRRADSWVPDRLLPPNIVIFAKRLDGLIDLLDATTDALAAMWEKESGEETFDAGDDFKPTIQ